eukprot:gene13220-15531_t
MKTNLKGGVWKNTEDEILKVAVMKYGKNQWARISSLLVRKTPAQCKARWYEWLDPSIKKTEWSKEEEEKLLHLAKIFPSQWKTVAPLVGRTASQCLEHYNKLLDAVQERDDTMAEDDPRRLRVGELEPNPETKPAKPDPIDMDEDEKETLSEAKARLSNTQGKKEKRKFREKQLEEARRLAYLQKKRELKAAGIILHEKKKNKEKRFDYAVEVPYFRKPMAGFYDTSQESIVDPGKDKQFINARLDKIEGEYKQDEQDRLNKIEEIRKKKREMTNLPDAIAQVSRVNDPEMTRTRTKLNMPAPQLTDDDLQEIAEFEKASKALVSGALPATGALVGAFQTPSLPTPARTVARTPMREDVVMMESQNLLAMAQAQTPLMGGANPSISRTPLPSATVGRTPNPLAVQLTPSRAGKIDIGDGERPQVPRTSVLGDLRNLPKPSVEYKLALPDEVPTIEEIDEESKSFSDDESERDLRAARDLKHKMQEKLRSRSTPLKRNLPRSGGAEAKAVSNTLLLDDSLEEETRSQVEKLISEEMIAIIQHDNKCYPPHDNVETGSGNDDDNWVTLTDRERQAAEAMISEESQSIEPSETRAPDYLAKFIQEWEATRDAFIRTKSGFIERSTANKSDLCTALSGEYDATLAAMKARAKRAMPMEKRIEVDTRQQVVQWKAIQNKITTLSDTLEQSELELSCFESLRINELAAIESRMKHIEHAVYDQCDRENNLQKRYGQLLEERNNLLFSKS